MWSICKKEWSQFFSNLTGYLTIVLFLLINGLFLFVFPDASIFEYGYASLEKFFDLSPWIFLFLIPVNDPLFFSLLPSGAAAMRAATRLYNRKGCLFA